MESSRIGGHGSAELKDGAHGLAMCAEALDVNLHRPRSENFCLLDAVRINFRDEAHAHLRE